WRTFRESPPGSVGHALGLGMLGAWPALAIGNFWGDRFTYVQMIAYFWVFVALMLKARELALADRAAAEQPEIAALQPILPARRCAAPRRLTRREQLMQKRLASK